MELEPEAMPKTPVDGGSWKACQMQSIASEKLTKMTRPVAAMVQRQWALDHCELLSTTTCTVNKL